MASETRDVSDTGDMHEYRLRQGYRLNRAHETDSYLTFMIRT
jgi:hypothetical protein